MRSLVDILPAVTFVTPLATSPAQAQVALPWPEDQRATVTLAPVGLTATLPEGGAARLTPQRGVVGALGALREVKVDDDAVDAAWVIHSDDAGLILALVPELRALAPFSPSIDVQRGAMTIRFDADPTDDRLAAAVEGCLALWHRAVFFRMQSA
jgi:hypothetical protein